MSDLPPPPAQPEAKPRNVYGFPKDGSEAIHLFQGATSWEFAPEAACWFFTDAEGITLCIPVNSWGAIHTEEVD